MNPENAEKLGWAFLMALILLATATVSYGLLWMLQQIFHLLMN